jgi:hypothetical protein
MFDGLAATLKERAELEQVGFAVADRWAYHQWIKKNPAF